MTKTNYTQWLETQIVKAQELGGMDLEIWAFKQCLKKARELGQGLPVPDVVGRSEQDCEHAVTEQKNLRCTCCEECGEILDVLD